MSDDTLLCVLAPRQTPLVYTLAPAYTELRTRSVYCCTLSELKGDHLTIATRRHPSMVQCASSAQCYLWGPVITTLKLKSHHRHTFSPV